MHGATTTISDSSSATTAISNGSISKNLDLSNLSKGVYMVNVSSDNGITTKKLIIQ